MYPLTDTQTAAISSGSSDRIYRKAEIRDPDGTVIGLLDLTAGTATQDETAQSRWSCTATVNTPDLVPGQIGDLLHPLTGNELHLFKGGAAAGVQFWVPMGVYRMTSPDTTNTVTGPTSETVGTVITGKDRSSEISRRAWTAPYDASGMTVEQVIADVLAARWTGPPLPMSLYPSGIVVPSGTILGQTYTSSGWQAESGSTSGGNDPWADLAALAKSAACELFFDRVGSVVMRPVPQIGTVADATTVFQEGAGCVVTQIERKLDETKFRNGVQLVATGARVTNTDGSTSPAAPIYSEAWSTDPLLGPTGPLGARPEQIVDQTISAQVDADARAAAELALAMSTLDDISLSAVDVFWVDCGDTTPVVRSKAKANGRYIPQTVTHPFDLGSQMKVTFRPFSLPTAA